MGLLCLETGSLPFNLYHILKTQLLNILSANLYSHGTGKISNLLNRPLHEFLGLTPVMILIIFFCSVNIFLLLHELPQKTIPSLQSENRQTKLI
jgi:hypothetical protein